MKTRPVRSSTKWLLALAPLLASAAFSAIDAATSTDSAQPAIEQAAVDPQASAPDGSQSLGAALGALGNMFGGGGPKVELVDFRKLKALLPAELPGFKRTSASGEKSSAAGMSESHAEAVYSDEQQHRITVKISDLGNLAALMMMGVNADIDKETDTGYEKTSMNGAYKFHEKYDTASSNGELSTMAGGRYSVEINGSGVSMEALKLAMSKVDLAQLDAMKAEGAQK